MRLSDDGWRKVDAMRIYFAHQSVGANIVEGVIELAREAPSARLRVVDGSPVEMSGPAFMHQLVGRNGDPRSKTAQFSAALDSGTVDDGRTVALHKYCYVDMDDSTDVDRLFEDYRHSVADVHARHPKLNLVHVTMPLTAVSQPNPVKAFAKRLIGRPESHELVRNVKRNHFNDLLRREYYGREPIFDLAGIESTLPDSSRSFFARDGAKVYTLARVYTDDGGHLNAVGRRIVAAQLLRFLASL